MADLQTHHLNGIQREIRALAQTTENVGRQVDGVQNKQVEMDGRLSTLSEMFNEFLRADALAKELNLAETRIVGIRQELETEYGHYADVRRRATGILQALDQGVVSHETIQNTTEDVMVASPRYWLAPALVALAAWSRDDRPLAEQALAEALRRDVAKTSLFYSLVLRRYERGAAAASWLREFFARQDPTALGREFIVVLDAVATGAYGVEGRSVATEEINVWLDELQHRSGFLDEQVDRWRQALLALRPAPSSGEYPHLEKHSAQWAQLADALATAGLHARVIAHFNAIFEGELRLPATLEREMDELLDRLVREFDTEELPLRKREAELQAIIDHGGDKSMAHPEAEQAKAALEESVDFPSLLTNAAMRPKEAGASRGSERLAVALSREWIVRAHDQITTQGRDAVPARIELTIEGWTGAIEDGTDADTLAAGLGQHIDRETQAQVDGVRYTGGPLVAAIGGGIVLAIGLVALQPVVIVLALVAVAYAVWGYYQLPKRRDAIRAAGAERRKRAEQLLHASLTELVDYHGQWATEDAHGDEAHDMLSNISPVDHLNAAAHGPRELV